jgi:DNA polymerase III epsilon subunit-like protein
MPSTSLVTLNDNTLAAMDVETTGREPGRHEVCQLAIVTLDCHLNPVTQFYSNIRPEYPQHIHPDATATHGLTLDVLNQAPDRYEVSDMLWDWFQSLQLMPGKRLIPLCHNCQFDIPFVQHMLGLDMFYEVFGYPTRDTQALVTAMMDKAAYQGIKIPFNRAGLGTCCEALGVKLDDAHDALADALATARVYKALLERPSW